MKIRRVSVLFAGVDTIYRGLVGVDVFDERRNALSFGFNAPVVAHPPCAQWSRMRGLSKAKPGEKALGLYAARVVQRCGGVLEHPEDSSLWAAAGLPAIGGGADLFGGVSVRVFQGDYGHYAAKATWLYIVGVRSELVRDLVRVLVRGRRSGLVRDRCSQVGRVADRDNKQDREATPLAFGQLLVHLARLSRVGREFT